MSSESSSGWFPYYLKVFVGALIVGLFIWVVLMVGKPESGERWSKSTSLSTLGARSSSSSMPMEQPKVTNHQLLDLNFVSKVRVPKGPNPIHNRRMGINGGPPS